MKRSGSTKFPNSVQLFKFCYKVLIDQRGDKVRDQEVGAILKFNPSDCSHWKRGEKSVRSVFSLEKLAEELNLELSLVHDIASGVLNLDEAYFEHNESRAFKDIFGKAKRADPEVLQSLRRRIPAFVEKIHRESDFSMPPLYLPEVLRTFPFITTQSVEMIERLSRALRVKTGSYCIQFKKGELKAQTRMSMVKDLARILFEAERARFPELGPADPVLSDLEQMLFIVNLLLPKEMLRTELSKVDVRRNVVAELAALFWVPKSLVSFQLQDILRDNVAAQIVRDDRPATTSVAQADLV